MSGNQWTLGAANIVTMELLWSQDKVDRRDADGEPIRRSDQCDYFEKELWFGLGKIMWRKHCYIFQYHVKCMRNAIVGPFRVLIFQY